MSQFRQGGRHTRYEPAVERAILDRLDDCDRLDEVLEALRWYLERLPENDDSVAMDAAGTTRLIKSNGVPPWLASPTVLLLYSFDADAVTWLAIEIGC